jgi:hypothetical protein
MYVQNTEDGDTYGECGGMRTSATEPGSKPAVL